jgi:hypothetical protein
MQWDSTQAINKTIQDYQDNGLNLPIYPSIQTYGVTTGSYSVCKNYGFKCYGYWDLDEEDNSFLSSLGSTIMVTSNDSLRQSIMALQYDCNMVHGTDLIVDGIAGTTTINTLNSYPINLDTNNSENQWIEQRLIAYGYLPKGSDTGYWTKQCFQAITNLQKNWGLSTDGVIGKDTWRVFLTN